MIDRADQRGRREHADTGNRLEPRRNRMCGRDRGELSIDAGDFYLESPDFVDDQAQRVAKQIDGEFLKVVIQPWLAEKLRIGAGSLVIVDNVKGKFTITRSAANDESTH